MTTADRILRLLEENNNTQKRLCGAIAAMMETHELIIGQQKQILKMQMRARQKRPLIDEDFPLDES